MKTTFMKRATSIFLAFVLALTTCVSTVVAFADEISYTFDEETGALVITGTGAMTDYDENTLANIPWYSQRANVKSVVVGEGITHIGDYAFCREVNLTEVSLPSTLTSIGDAAFAGANVLKELYIPDGVTEVGEYAFGHMYDMSLSEDFVAFCAPNSAAQQYCIKSYVPFEVPFSADGDAYAEILGSNWQAMWSFVPVTSGTITFWSTGGADTFGLIYDASDYTYSTKFSEMQKSAKKTGDDISSTNCNFRIEFSAQAGVRYYLAAKYMSATKTSGGFDVHMTFVCDEHNYDCNDTATCTEDGTKTYTCVGCGDTYQEESLAKGHVSREFPAIENEVTATCVIEGTYDEVYYCSVCEQEISRDQKSRGFAEHNYQAVEVLDPTCVDAGCTLYQCTECLDPQFRDFVDPTGHTPGEKHIENDTAATCTAPGYYDEVVRCIECEAIISEERFYSNPIDHDYAVTTIDSTCTTPGKSTYVCKACGDEYSVDLQILDHTPGTMKVENEKAPTCTNAGHYDEVIRCTECGTIVEEQRFYIDPIGHSYSAIDFADGIVGTVCANCDDYQTIDFNAFLNGTNDILDIVTDGIVNAKDYAKFRREYPAPDVACDIDLTAGTVSRDNATLEDGVLTLTPNGRYSFFNITGDSENIVIVVNASRDAEIKLNNANITVDSANAITINNIADEGVVPEISISATELSNNSITTTTTGNAISNYADAGACKLEFKGHGTLVMNTASTAINSGAKVEIKNVTLDITSGNRGIDTKFTNTEGIEDYANVSIKANAKITIQSADDGIRCKNFEITEIAEPDVASVLTINAGGDGIQMEGKKSVINSGDINITATGYAFNNKAAVTISPNANVNATGKKGYSKV